MDHAIRKLSLKMICFCHSFLMVCYYLKRQNNSRELMNGVQFFQESLFTLRHSMKIDWLLSCHKSILWIRKGRGRPAYSHLLFVQSFRLMRFTAKRSANLQSLWHWLRRWNVLDMTSSTDFYWFKLFKYIFYSHRAQFILWIYLSVHFLCCQEQSIPLFKKSVFHSWKRNE